MSRSPSPKESFFPQNLPKPLINTQLLAVSAQKTPVPKLKNFKNNSLLKPQTFRKTPGPSLFSSPRVKPETFRRVGIKNQHKLPSLNAGISLL